MHGRNLASTGAHAAAFAALAVIALLGGCRDNATTGPSHAQAKDFAAAVRSISGDQQVGVAGVALAQQVTVRVLDANGNPVVGATVTFGVRTGGGSISPPADTSGSDGQVSATWTLGMTVGAQSLAARVANVDSVTFTATATPPVVVGGGPTDSVAAAVPTNLVIISGSGQVGRSRTALTAPLVVEIDDQTGHPIPGVTMIFTQAAGNSDGFTSPSPVVSGADGRVSVIWTLGGNGTNTTVTQSLTATLPGYPSVAGKVFLATARPDFRIVRIRTPTIMSDTTGATIGYPGDYLAGVRDTLIVQVYDPTDSTGVQGVAVSWNVVTVNGGSAVNSVVNTDNFGFAKTTWNLVGAHPSSVAHRMIATASVGQVEFQAKVYPGNGVGVSVSSPPPPDSAGTGSTFTVTVTDVGGNPIPGAVVTHTAVGGGGAVFDPGVPTGSAGTLLFGWHFGGVHGSVQSVTVMSVSTGFYGNVTTAFGFVAVETP